MNTKANRATKGAAFPAQVGKHGIVTGVVMTPSRVSPELSPRARKGGRGNGKPPTRGYNVRVCAIIFTYLPIFLFVLPPIAFQRNLKSLRIQ